MINIPLFKQSCKANWIKWVAVTLSTCVMLGIIIIVLGNLGINDIRDSLKNVFVQADQESTLKENAVDSYELYFTSIDGYKTLSLTSSMLDTLTEEFDSQVDSLGATTDVNMRAQIISAIVDSTLQNPMLATMDKEMIGIFLTQYLTIYSNSELSGEEMPTKDVMMSRAYANTVFEVSYQTAITDGKSEQEAMNMATVSQMIASDAVGKYQLHYMDSDYNYNQDARNCVNTILSNQAIMTLPEGTTEEEKREYAVTVKVLSNTAISTYQLWLNELVGQDDAKEQARFQAVQSISDQIPDKVAEALEELGEMDMYSLIIGSIFYRIAGLLLPMVFVIMTANGLLAGQVDSGSLAYVLSTPTKRRNVAITQLAYLLFSLFAMFALLTVTSTIAVWVAGGNNFSINYAEILLLNAGAYITMFAIAGFCFMCSAIFNSNKHSLSIGGGLTIFSLVCTILGLFGSNVIPSAMRIPAMDFFNYLSIITLFDATSILNGTINYLWKFGVLAAFGIITIIVGIFRFDKKDLPL